MSEELGEWLAEESAKVDRLCRLLKEARRYVSDTVGEEDMEVKTHSAVLLKEIDSALADCG